MTDPLEALLAEIVDCEEVHLVVKNEAATSELRGRGALRTGDEWLTIEIGGGSDHVHVRRGQLASAEFVVTPGKNRGVRFHAEDGRVVLTCIVPRTKEDDPNRSAERLHRFERIEANHRSAAWRRDRGASS
jgi:Haem utilisation ChuX/HutX